jgi:hypothetical protein
MLGLTMSFDIMPSFQEQKVQLASIMLGWRRSNIGARKVSRCKWSKQGMQVADIIP